MRRRDLDMTFFLSFVSTRMFSRFDPKSLSPENGYDATMSLDFVSACHTLSHRALRACSPAAMDLDVNTRLSRIASAMKALPPKF